jgi:hypothetical protein
MVEATIEDFAIMTRSLRESDEVRRRCCIEHDFANGLKMRAITGKEDSVIGWSSGAQFGAADKSGEEWCQKSSRKQNHSQKPKKSRKKMLPIGS